VLIDLLPGKLKLVSFALPKAHSNTDMKLLNYSAMEMWSQDILDLKSNASLELHAA